MRLISIIFAISVLGKECPVPTQYQDYIHYDARILSKRLAAAGIRHTYKEFDDNHSGIDYRMDVSLPFLYEALR